VARDRASRPEARSLRLFVAVEVPPAAQRAVDEAVAPWREAFPRARWVPPENRHVTLRFLGQTWPRLRGWVGERVAAAAAGGRPFEVALAGLGSFPSATRGRVLWVGLDDPAARMASLAAALDAELAEEFRPETRPFAAHLTVARSDPPVALPPGFADTAVAPVRFRVDRVVLFRSHLRRPAPRYEPLETFPLGAPAEG
jgi:2'-5' RNA ligase